MEGEVVRIHASWWLQLSLSWWAWSNRPAAGLSQPGRGQTPHSLYFWLALAWLCSPAFIYHLKNFHFNFWSMDPSTSTLLSLGRWWRRKIPTWPSQMFSANIHTYTHTHTHTHTWCVQSGVHSLALVNTRLHSNCAWLGPWSRWLHLIRNLQGSQSQNLDVYCTH